MTKKTLIDFPCHFPIKIIGINSPSFLENIKKIAKKQFPGGFSSDDFIQKNSKNDNYLAITVTVFAVNQQELDDFYQALSKLEGVKMVL